LRFDGDTSAVAEVRLLTLRRAARRLDEPVAWAGEFPAAASVTFLRPAVLGEPGSLSASSQRVRERLLSAIAVHDDGAAVEVVLAALDSSQAPELRESAVFWTSQVGGDDGLQRLLDVARNDANAEVRMASIFWLGQEGGERAVPRLVDIYKTAANHEAKEMVLMALGQNGSDAAMDFVVHIARNESRLELRKKAIFWLGQSDDPKAKDALLEIINQ